MRAVVYARYSTELQSEHSIEDQLRTCHRIAERHGFEVVQTFSDAAISGGTVHRPGYQAMLQAARRQEFKAILAEDASRLWRNLGEQAPRLAELADLGIAIVTADFDSRSESAGILGAVLGATGEVYRKEIARRTRRGLEGRALARKPTGGKAFGYIAARDGATGQVEVNVVEAEIVRRIFAEYAAGYSARRIANGLNVDRIPSPGSTWHRQKRRKVGWLASAIHGDPVRGTGILGNEAYRGAIIWNRSRWVRSATDSKQRRQIINPRAEWIEYREPRLQIVPDELWERVKARQLERQHIVGERIKAGLAPSIAGRTGRGPGYLFSGLMRCAICGSSFVMADRAHYACAGRINGGAAICTNDARIRRDKVENGLLAEIKQRAEAPEVLEQLALQVRRRLREQEASRPDFAARTCELEQHIEHLADAIGNGGLHTSRTLGQRLQAAERELAVLKDASAQSPKVRIERLIPRLADRWRQFVANFEKRIRPEDIPAFRQEIARFIGPIRVRATREEILLETQEGHAEIAFLRAAGFNNTDQQISVVAGVGFEPTTFGL
jgi:site-specific DNA recombinase